MLSLPYERHKKVIDDQSDGHSAIGPIPVLAVRFTFQDAALRFVALRGQLTISSFEGMNPQNRGREIVASGLLPCCAVEEARGVSG
jgi:hypothetical protein